MSPSHRPPPGSRRESILEYVFSRYGRLMTPAEQEEFARLSLKQRDSSPVKGRSSGVAESGTDRIPGAGSGFRMEAFKKKVARRLLREHAKEIQIHHCSRCRALVWDSKRRQCLECGHDWKITHPHRP